MSDREVKVNLRVNIRPFLNSANAAAVAIGAFKAANARAAIRHEQDLAVLRALVPDETERQGYLDVTFGNPATAYKIACHGITVDTARDMREAGVPAEWITDMVEYGPERAGEIAAVLLDCIPYGFIPDHRLINALLIPTDARRTP